MTDTEAHEELEFINRLAGTSRDILVCRDLNAANLGEVTIWGVLDESINYPQTDPNQYRAELTVWDRL